MSLFSSHLLPSPLFHVSTYFYACPSASICISSDICPPLSSYFFLLFRAFRLYRALGLRFWQNTSGSSLLSPWFFSRLSVCLRNVIQQQNDTCATFPLLKVETVLRKKKKTKHLIHKNGELWCKKSVHFFLTFGLPVDCSIWTFYSCSLEAEINYNVQNI